MAIELITVKCPRCNDEVQTLKQPIYGSTEAMQKFRGVCGKCITKEELDELDRLTKAALEVRFGFAKSLGAK